MSAIPGTQQHDDDADDAGIRLHFFKKLQAVTNKSHATSNINEIMLDLSQDICDLFHWDRLTIYAVSEDKTSIVSKVKTGLNAISQLKLAAALEDGIEKVLSGITDMKQARAVCIK